MLLPDALPLLASTLLGYVALGAAALFRVRRRLRTGSAARAQARAALRAG